MISATIPLFELCQALLAKTDEGVWIIDPNYQTLRVNPALVSMLGYRPEVMTGQSALDFIDPKDQKEANQWLNAADSNESIEVGLLKADRDFLPCLLRQAPLQEKDSGSSKLLLVKDLSQMRQNEALLAESQMRYRHLTQTTNEGVVILQQGKVVFANANFSGLLNQNSEDLIGKNFLNLLEPAYRDQIAKIQTARLSGEDAPKEYRFKLKSSDAKEILVQESLTNHGQQSALLLCLQSVGQAQNSISLSQQSLMSRLTYLDALFEKLPLAAWIVDHKVSEPGDVDFSPARRHHHRLGRQMVISRVNEAFEAMTGYDRQEIAGRSVLEPILLNEQEAEQMCDTLAACDLNASFSTDLSIKNRQGSRIPVKIHSIVLDADDQGSKVEKRLEVLVDMRDANETIQKLEEVNQQLQEMSLTDPLTNLGNRRAFDDKLADEWARAVRHTSELSLIMIDIDYFKSYNDSYGHPQGDECLRKLGYLFKAQVHRSTDMIARYGGEEFSLILPETSLQAALKIAEHIRRAVEKSAITHESSPMGRVTLSLGVASSVPKPGMNSSYLVRAADQALYLSKQQGKNQVNAGFGEPPKPISVRLPALDISL